MARASRLGSFLGTVTKVGSPFAAGVSVAAAFVPPATSHSIACPEPRCYWLFGRAVLSL